MRFSLFFKPNHKLPSLAYTSVLPHAFPYFGRPKYVLSPLGCSNTNKKSLGSRRAATCHEPIVA